MPEAKPVKKAPKAVPAKPFVVADPKCGTEAQQVELFNFLSACTAAQMDTVKALFRTMTSGACINGDGTIDPATGLRTTGGYRKSMHYIREYLKNRPVAVDL